MGYCYEGNKLCCDICGKTGARKYKCPFGYCQAIASCAECRRNRPAAFSKAGHRENGCETSHIAFAAHEKARADAIASGDPVLSAGMFLHNQTEWVHAIFTGKDGVIGRYIPSFVYEGRAVLATLSSFEKAHGKPLLVAPTDFLAPGGSYDKSFVLTGTEA